MLLGPVMTPVLPYPHLDHANTQYPGSLPSLHMPPTKRPKLSLQTSHLSVNYSTSSGKAGPRIETMSTTTPTTSNTFSNTFDLTIRPSPNSATTSAGPFSRTRSACPTSYTRRRPYDLNLPFGKRPILKHSSLGQEYRSNLTSSASPRYGRKVFFPAPKRVSFEPIEEEIVTHTYVARHYDLSASSDDESWDETGVAQSTLKSDEIDQETEGQVTTSTTATRSPDGLKRSRSTSSQDPSSRQSTRKKRRWEWTLGDLEREEARTLSSTTSEESQVEAEAEPAEESNTEQTETVAAGTSQAIASANEVSEVPSDVVAEEVSEQSDHSDSDWETVTSSAISTPQNISPAKLEEIWEDPTITQDV